ncbi:MAG: hypothetical protein Q7S86_01120 [bacterium]|nr:hypothetical protein [bacterium]
MKSSIILRSVIVILVLSAIGGYALYESRNIINGPQLALEEPKNGLSTSNSTIEIKGQAQNISSISINDRKITVDEAGWFKEKILLSVGYNIIKISVYDKFGRAKETLMELVRMEQKEGLVRK